MAIWCHEVMRSLEARHRLTWSPGPGLSEVRCKLTAPTHILRLRGCRRFVAPALVTLQTSGGDDDRRQQVSPMSLACGHRVNTSCHNMTALSALVTIHRWLRWSPGPSWHNSTCLNTNWFPVPGENIFGPSGVDTIRYKQALASDKSCFSPLETVLFWSLLKYSVFRTFVWKWVSFISGKTEGSLLLCALNRNLKWIKCENLPALCIINSLGSEPPLLGVTTAAR